MVPPGLPQFAGHGLEAPDGLRRAYHDLVGEDAVARAISVIGRKVSPGAAQSSWKSVRSSMPFQTCSPAGQARLVSTPWAVRRSGGPRSSHRCSTASRRAALCPSRSFLLVHDLVVGSADNFDGQDVDSLAQEPRR